MHNLSNLNLSNTKITDASSLIRIKILDISFSAVSDVSAFGRPDCQTHTLIAHNTPITDTSMLGKIIKLDLHKSDINDISMLMNVEELNIGGTHWNHTFTNCNVKKLGLNSITVDVANLPNLIGVEELDLSDSRLTDVSMFTGPNCRTRKLNISGTEVRDISALQPSNIRYLNVGHNFVMKDFSIFGRPDCQINTLIANFTSVTDVSMFGRLYELDLSNTCVFDVSMLGNVHILSIDSTNITDVSMLGNVRILSINCTKISNINIFGAPTSKTYRLSANNTLITDVSALAGAGNRIKSLAIAGNKIWDISMLNQIYSLNIRNTLATDFSTFGRPDSLTRVLYIDFMEKRDFPFLHKIHKLYISRQDETTKELKNLHSIFPLSKYIR
jgi:Leucine-rich repeat (LRR) protein